MTLHENTHSGNVTDAVSLADLRHLYRGGRLFILGTGPSLADAAPYFGRLQHESTFGVNLLLRWPEMNFTPTFYAIQELRYWFGLRIQDNAQLVLARKDVRLPAVRFYAHTEPVPELDAQGWTFVEQDLQCEMQSGFFAGFDQPLAPVPFGSSVAMFATMLGVWMGFEEIVLLGCDATKRGHVYARDESVGEPLERLRQDSFVRAALTAKEVMEANGVRLLDATGPRGQLTLPKVDLADLL